MTTRPTPTEAALRQGRPFASKRAEALVALLLTAERARWPFADLLAREADVTLQQYNVLRILRGAGGTGLPTLEIAERMIERTPGITRLLDRLEAKGLVARERGAGDRRVVLCRITRAGLALLARLDAPVARLDEQACANLTAAQVRTLIQLLDQLRGEGP
jgi:DNA-binding MarR family transcriptional regulator